MHVRTSIAATCAGLVPAGGAWAQEFKKMGGMLVNGAGMTLCTWSRDTKPDDMTGDNFNNVWQVVKD